MPSAASGPALGTAPAPPADEARWAEMADAGVDAIAALLLRARESRERTEAVPGAGHPVRDQIDMLREESAGLLETTERLVQEAAPFVERAKRTARERYPAALRLRGAYRRIQGGTERPDAETRTR